MTLATITDLLVFAVNDGQVGPVLAPKLLGTYFADASDAGPVDTGPNWSGDANAFDGTISTVAGVFVIGTDALLSGDGTTAPTTGDPIDHVRWRHRINVDGGGLAWSRWLLLNKTGWTWQLVNDLAVEIVYDETFNFVDINIQQDAVGGATLGADRVPSVDTSFDIAKVEFQVFGLGTDLYVIGITSADDDAIHVMKSDDGGATWAEQDSGNRPTMPTALTGAQSMSMVLDGTIIHIAATSEEYTPSMTDFQDIEYMTFDTTTDLHDLQESVVTIDIDATSIQRMPIDIAVRSDGDVIIVHHISDKTDMGGGFSQYGYSVRELGSWTTEVPFNAANEDQTHVRCIMAPGDECHIHYAIAGGESHALTLDVNNNLSTQINPFSVGSSGLVLARPVTWAGGTEQKILIGSIETTNETQVRRLEEDGSGDLALDLATANPPSGLESVSSNNALAFDPVDENAYVFWKRTSDTDLFYNVGFRGTNWDTLLEAEDGINHNKLWVQYYERGGGRQIGYVIRQGSSPLEFNELEIEAPPSGGPAEKYRQTRIVQGLVSADRRSS
jgi:hypothetical protein